jgi:hypothetical protein
MVLVMNLDEWIGYLQPTLAQEGFTLDEVQPDLKYGERDAWAAYFKRDDCKLQLCWSDRTGGLNWMIAPLDAPNEFALQNSSEKWKYMLMLSTASDSLKTPRPGADTKTEMEWLKALFKIHFPSAHAALAGQARG